MCALYPFLVPLTHEAKSFREPVADVRKRVSQRFGISQTEDALNDIIFKKKIDQIFIMGNPFNYEGNLQIITDILGYGGYDHSKKYPLA